MFVLFTFICFLVNNPVSFSYQYWCQRIFSCYYFLGPIDFQMYCKMLDSVRVWILFSLLFVAGSPPAEVRARGTWVCLLSFLLLLVNHRTKRGAESQQWGGGGLTLQQPGWHPPVHLSASRCNWKGSFPLGSADIRVGEGPSGGPRGPAPSTSPCLTDAGKGGVLASPGIHWRKEKADYQLPHPPTLPLSA